MQNRNESYRIIYMKFLVPIVAGIGILFSTSRGILHRNISPTPVVETAIGQNPFGVMVGSPLTMSVDTKMKIASTLGALYYRPTTALFLDNLKVQCRECLAATQNGFRLILTVRNGGGRGTPSNPPTNEKTYLDSLSIVLDTYKPTILAVENEENSMELFYSGTPSEYHRELSIACNLAHNKNIKCTNGGFVSSLVIGLIYEDYVQKGQQQQADTFLNMALTPDKISEFESQSEKISLQLSRGKELLSGLKQSGADYVNFHWYSDSPEALKEAKTYMESMTGLPAISNEMGQQQNTDPTQVTAIMQKVVDLKMPIAVWYSIDTLTHGQAKALTDRNGNLRENGVAFQQFIQTTFPR